MPTAARDGGVEIHYEPRGEGPLVVLAAHWYAHPAVLQRLCAELVRDHRMVTYDPRGVGASTRTGPYDLATDTADLAAVVDAAGGSGVALGWGDGAFRAIRLAVERPDMVPAVVAIGANPLGLAMLAGLDSPVGSSGVQDALELALKTDYRSTIRGLLRASSIQMSEEEMRARVNEQIAYCPQETALARADIWRQADPTQDAARLGDRLSVLLFETEMAPPEDVAARTRERVPGAHVEILENGPVTRPDLTAEATRRVTERIRAQAG
jgi:pimeloyl-ACP methyl ester carboxylesterase